MSDTLLFFSQQLQQVAPPELLFNGFKTFALEKQWKKTRVNLVCAIILVSTIVILG
jgi:hypothetical protein